MSDVLDGFLLYLQKIPEYAQKSKKQKLKSYYFGIVAEFIVIVFLFLKGYKIIARRYKTYSGEIDIIARTGKNFIAVEVKARKNKVLVDEVLSVNQQRRISNAMDIFLSRNQKKLGQYGVRFDLIIVHPFKVPRHFKGFWH